MRKTDGDEGINEEAAVTQNVALDIFFVMAQHGISFFSEKTLKDPRKKVFDSMPSFKKTNAPMNAAISCMRR